jgi:hypothetical protein
MDSVEVSVQVPECPEGSDQLEAQIRQAVKELIDFVRRDSDALQLMEFERLLWSRVAVLFRLCVALFLAVRHRGLDLSGYEAEGWRVKKESSPRARSRRCAER